MIVSSLYRQYATQLPECVFTGGYPPVKSFSYNRATIRVLRSGNQCVYFSGYLMCEYRLRLLDRSQLTKMCTSSFILSNFKDVVCTNA